MLVGWATGCPLFVVYCIANILVGNQLPTLRTHFRLPNIMQLQNNTFLQILLTKIICKYVYLRKLTNKQRNFTQGGGSIADSYTTFLLTLFWRELC